MLDLTHNIDVDFPTITSGDTAEVSTIGFQACCFAIAVSGAAVLQLQSKAKTSDSWVAEGSPVSVSAAGVVQIGVNDVVNTRYRVHANSGTMTNAAFIKGQPVSAPTDKGSSVYIG